MNVGNAWLARFGGQVAYVVGGAEGHRRPVLGLQGQLAAGAHPLDRRRHALGRALRGLQLAGGDWFPRAVEVSRDGERQVRFTTLSGDPRANVPDRLF